MLAPVEKVAAAASSTAPEAVSPPKRVFVYKVRDARASALTQALSQLLAAPATEAADKPAAVPTLTLPSIPGITPAEPVEAGPRKTSAGQTEFHFSVAGTILGGAGPINVVGDDNNNTVAVFASEPEYGRIEPILRTLDVPPTQVFLEAAIVEVSLNDASQFGLQYFYRAGAGQQLVLSDSKTTTIGPTAPGFSYVFSRGTNLQVILDALANRTRVEVISAPKLLVLNLQTANLGAGSRVPFATKQAIDIVTSSPAITNEVQYRDTGVVLEVTPRIGNEDGLTLDIVEEVSQPTATTTSKIDSPTFEQRKISSRIRLRDGETVALGGLITDERIKTKTGIPYLEKLPVVGNLFGDNAITLIRTELVVLITPHIVRDSKQLRGMTQDTISAAPTTPPVLDRAH